MQFADDCSMPQTNMSSTYMSSTYVSEANMTGEADANAKTDVNAKADASAPVARPVRATSLMDMPLEVFETIGRALSPDVPSAVALVLTCRRTRRELSASALFWAPLRPAVVAALMPIMSCLVDFPNYSRRQRPFDHANTIFSHNAIEPRKAAQILLNMGWVCDAALGIAPKPPLHLNHGLDASCSPDQTAVAQALAAAADPTLTAPTQASPSTTEAMFARQLRAHKLFLGMMIKHGRMTGAALEHAACDAACVGSLALFRATEPLPDSSTFEYLAIAANMGHADLVAYIDATYHPLDDETLRNFLLRRGHAHMLAWYRATRGNPRDDPLMRAAWPYDLVGETLGNADLPMLHELIGHGWLGPTPAHDTSHQVRFALARADTIYYAARRGDVPLLRQLRALGLDSHDARASIHLCCRSLCDAWDGVAYGRGRSPVAVAPPNPAAVLAELRVNWNWNWPHNVHLVVGTGSSPLLAAFGKLRDLDDAGLDEELARHWNMLPLMTRRLKVACLEKLILDERAACLPRLREHWGFTARDMLPRHFEAALQHGDAAMVRQLVACFGDAVDASLNLFVRMAVEHGRADAVEALRDYLVAVTGAASRRPRTRLASQRGLAAARNALPRALEVTTEHGGDERAAGVLRALRKCFGLGAADARAARLLVKAARRGAASVLSELKAWQLGHADARADNNEAYLAAAAGGHVAAMRVLRLEFGLTPADASARNHMALRHAASPEVLVELGRAWGWGADLMYQHIVDVLLHVKGPWPEDDTEIYDAFGLDAILVPWLEWVRRAEVPPVVVVDECDHRQIPRKRARQ